MATLAALENLGVARSAFGTRCFVCDLLFDVHFVDLESATGKVQSTEIC